MFAWLTSKRARQRTARELYGSIVTQARQRALYADLGVPDTLQGRFEMIVLHLAIVLERLEREPSTAGLARALAESFVVDMDDGMRELTFGDLAVPREIKRAVAALYDRHRAYRAALVAPHKEAREAALALQLAYLHRNRLLDVAALAAYMHRAAAALATQLGVHIAAGRLEWPHVHESKPRK